MARSSTCCLVLMVLCLSLLHPAFARKGRKSSASATTTTIPALAQAVAVPPATKAPPPTTASAVAPLPSTQINASKSLAVIVASQKGKSFTKHICELAADPSLCSKILKSDDKFLASLPRGTTSKLSLELSAAIAAKAVFYMTEKLSSEGMEAKATTLVNGCLENYQEAIIAYNGAYANFTADPIMASTSLHVADEKIGMCESKLSVAGSDNCVPRIGGTNKLLRDLIVLIAIEMSGEIKH